MNFSDNLLFLPLAALLLILVLGLLLPPLWRRRQAGVADDRQRSANLQVLRGQLAELEQERQQGLLDDAAFAQAKDELQRRLLEEVGPADGAAAQGSSRAVALALVVLLPVLAGIGYVMLGTPQALSPLAATRGRDITPAQIEQMVAKLAERVQAAPDDAEAGLMLARSYKVLGRLDQAAAAYGRLETAIADNPDALADYADLLAQQAGGRLDGKPLALVRKALALDPGHVQSLWLLGTAQFAAADYAGAAASWQRAIAQLEPGSEDARLLGEGVAEAQRRATFKPDAKKTIRGQVVLAPELRGKVSPDDTVFVFARAADGSRMPLAIARGRVADLPLAFVLDDSSAMDPANPLSRHPEVVVVARISATGNAVPKAGDPESEPRPARLGQSGLRISVDRRH